MTTSSDVRIRRLSRFGAREIRGLADVLIDCVEGGASVSFMLPITREKAESFWLKSAESAMRGERLILAAEDAEGTIVGTVTVILDLPENQPHRGDLAKMLVRRAVRGRGVGAALLQAAEDSAREAGRTLLVLDTVTGTAGNAAARYPTTRSGQTAEGAQPRSTTSF